MRIKNASVKSNSLNGIGVLVNPAGTLTKLGTIFTYLYYFDDFHKTAEMRKWNEQEQWRDFSPDPYKKDKVYSLCTIKNLLSVYVLVNPNLFI